MVKDCSNCGREQGSKECNTCVSRVDSYGITIRDCDPSMWILRDEPDVVNHPSHYQTKSGLETIQVIGAFTEDLKGIEAVCTGNVIKYICRWKKKNGLQDLKKAEWYLEHLIKNVEKYEQNN